MKKLLSFLFLLLASPAYAQYITRTDCGTFTPPATDGTACLQTTTVSGRTAGHIYIHRGGVWVDVDTGGSGGGGTVTSVAVTVPSFLSVTGSPITTNGTFAISLSGTGLPIANGGTGATSPSAARTALGLGTIATQAANNVAITGGNISGLSTFFLPLGNTPGAVGELSYITNQVHAYVGGANRILVPRATTTPTSGNCAQWGASGLLAEAAAPCGTSSGNVTVSGTPGLNKVTKFPIAGSNVITNSNITDDGNSVELGNCATNCATISHTGVTGAKTFALQNLAGSIAMLENNLGSFAATTSAQLAGVLSDETGSGGGFVRATSPTLTTPIITDLSNMNHTHAASASGGQLTSAAFANGALPLSKIAVAAANSKLVGSGAAGVGVAYTEITLGSGLTMTGTTLSSSGGSATPGGNSGEVQYNCAGSLCGHPSYVFSTDAIPADVFTAITLDDVEDSLIVGDVNSATVIRSNLAAPSTLANGKWWVECSGTTPTETCELKVRNGSNTRVIATVTN